MIIASAEQRGERLGCCKASAVPRFGQRFRDERGPFRRGRRQAQAGVESSAMLSNVLLKIFCGKGTRCEA